MKKYLFIIIGLFLLLSGCVYAQGDVREYTVSFDSGSVVSHAIETPSFDFFYGAVVIPHGIADTVKFEAQDQKNNWFWVNNPSTGLTYISVLDSSKASVVALPRDYFYPYKNLRITINGSTLTPRTIYILARQYK